MKNQLQDVSSKQDFDCTGNYVQDATTPPDNFIQVDDSRFPPSNDGADADLLKKLKRMRKADKKRLARHKAAVKVGTPGRQKMTMRACVSSAGFRICAAVDANKKLVREKRRSLSELFETASNLRWSKSLDEESALRRRNKPGGGKRPYFDFEIGNRTRFKALCRLYAPFFVPAPFQYHDRGKGHGGGVSLAIRELRKALIANPWVIHLDIKDFFPSFTENGIRQLVPLLGRMAPHAMGDHLDNVVLKDAQSYESISHIISQARMGGPQGSAFSSLLSMIIVSRMTWESSLPLFNMYDNFLIVGPTKEAVLEAANTLIAKVSALPGGDFKLHEKSFGHVSDGFEFLGHDLRMNDQGKIEIEPTTTNQLLGRLEPLFVKLKAEAGKGNKPKAVRMMGEIWCLTRSWANIFRECDDAQFWLNEVKSDLEPIRQKFGITWKEMNAFRPPGATWKGWYGT